MKVFSQVGASLQRSPRRRGLFAVVAVAVALAAAGAAVAWHGPFSAGLVSATFYANTVANSRSQTCTAANNDSIQVTDATFSGTAASSDPNLNGPITIDVRSVYDTTTNAGSLTGDVLINNSTATPPASFEGRLTTVNVSGHVQGLLVGSENGGGQLLANVTAAFSPSGGFNSPSSLATIGSGTGTDTAIVGTRSCPGLSAGDQDQDDNGNNGADHGTNGHGHHVGPDGHH